MAEPTYPNPSGSVVMPTTCRMIVAYKDSWDAEGRQYEWDKAVEGAVAARDVDGDGGNMNWTVYLGIRFWRTARG